jgi:hypothetical protein
MLIQCLEDCWRWTPFSPNSTPIAILKTAPTLKDILGNTSPSIQGSYRKLVHSNICVRAILTYNNRLTDDILVIASGQVAHRDEIHARAARAVMDMEASADAFYADTFQRGMRTNCPAATRVKKRLSPAAEPSVSTPSAVAPTPRLLPNPRETAVISKIRRGVGISSFELQGLLEQCGICQKYFAGSVLCDHIFLCSHN